MSAPHYTDEQITLYHGDCVEVLASLPETSVDAVVCDPPYGLEFMGKQWDSFKPANAKIRTRVDDRTNGAAKSVVSTPEAYVAGQPFQAWCETWARECLRVLKPGGHLLAFGGSRTWHRLAAGIEDAGFEMRDSIAWLYGSGFPKSMDVSKAIDRAAGAQREVIGSANGARNGNGQNVDYGAFGSAIDGSYSLTAPATDAAKRWQGWGTALKPAFEPVVVARKPLDKATKTVAANVLAHGTGALNIDACRVGEGGQLKWSTPRAMGYHGGTATNGAVAEANSAGRWPTNVLLDGEMAGALDEQSGVQKSGTAVQRNGGASRFFPTFRYSAKAATAERPSADGVAHPTVKPVELMRWLIRLVTPPSGTVLDPFAGSGTTGEAAIHEHKHAILIEREPTYLPLIIGRLSKPIAVGFDFESDAS